MFWFVVVRVLRGGTTFRPQVEVVRIFERLWSDLIFGLRWNLCSRNGSPRVFGLVRFEEGLNLGGLFLKIELGPLFFLLGVLTKILDYFLVVNHLICCIRLLERNLKLRGRRSLAANSVHSPTFRILGFWVGSKRGQLILVKRLLGGMVRGGVFVISTAYRLRWVCRLANRSV